ncbi:hypothetical protein BJV77DRAFT_1060873 [Russula vinacea]|nr:hypothetical protein BJV77DRAFT_1060873 [Russula vinacea]
MCGRFALALQWVNRDRYVPRYNVAPRTHAPVIRRAQPEEPALVMHSMRWGLVPHWSKAEPPTLNTINARAENLEEGGGMWASVKGRKRCAVVAQGYYEWLRKGPQRIPHFTRHKDQRLMLFAGLYDSVTLEGQSEPLWTFTIVTTAASSGFAWLHDRQPVILTSQDALDRWLDTSTQTWDPKLNSLLGSYDEPDAPLECYAVPREVGKVGTESPTFIEPVQKRKDGIEAMFTRQTKAAQAQQRSDTKRKRESVSPAKDEEEEKKKEMGTSAPAVKPRTKKEESGITTPSSPSGSQPQRQQQQKNKNKKQEKSDLSSPPTKSRSTPKITSFFTKTAG